MRLAAYSLLVDCAIPLPGLPQTGAAASGRTLLVRAAARDELSGAWSGPVAPPRRALREVDGRPLVIERGAGGDVLVTWGEEGCFHIDTARMLLRAWAPDPGDPRWLRVLLDSALGTAALVTGVHALHAGAVLTPAGVIAVSGPSGAGKTTLVAELLARGHPLVCDDILAIEPHGAGFLAHPGPPVANLPRDAAALGRSIAVLDDEVWVAIDHVAPGPAPLRAIVLLQRGVGERVTLEPVVLPAVPLLGALLSPGSDPERQMRHFELAADLGERVALWRLSGPADAPPAAFADRLLATLGA